MEHSSETLMPSGSISPEATGSGKVAIAVAPTGARRTKADHPCLPVTAAEIAAAAAACRDAGAAMIHLHVRDGEGRHLLDADAYAAATAAIRRAVGQDLVIQITTESVGSYTPEQQAGVLHATRPEAASLAMREFMPDAAHETSFTALLGWMAGEDILAQIILYDTADVMALADLQRRGMIPWESVPVLFVLGRYSANLRSSPTDLLPFLAPDVPRFAHWSVCAFGPEETACVTAAAMMGGHVRVGFENNLLLPDGRRASDNAELVSTTTDIVRRAGLHPASADELRNDLRNCRR